MKIVFLAGFLAAVSAPAMAQTQELALLDQFYARHRLPMVNSGESPDDVVIDEPSWVTTSWGNWSTACSPKSVRSRTVTCEKNDQIVGNEQCSEPKPAVYEQAPIYTGCVFIENGDFEDRSYESSFGVAPWTVSSTRLIMVDDAFSGSTALACNGNYGCNPGTRLKPEMIIPGHYYFRAMMKSKDCKISGFQPGVVIHLANGKKLSERIECSKNWVEVTLDIPQSLGITRVELLGYQSVYDDVSLVRLGD